MSALNVDPISTRDCSEFTLSALLPALDFHATASMFVNLEDTADEEFEKQIAVLIGALEGEATLAIEHQEYGLSAADLGLITSKIDRHLAQSRQILSDFSKLLDHAR